MEVERHQLFGSGSGSRNDGADVIATQAPGQVFHRRVAAAATIVSNTSLAQTTLSDLEVFGSPKELRKDKVKYCKVATTQMNGSNLANGPIESRMAPNSRLVHCVNCFLGVALRICIFIIFIQLERCVPFKRKIHPEELWLYKNPPTVDYIPASILLPASFVVPFLIICTNFLIVHDRHDFIQGISALTLSLGLNGMLTSLLKVTVGRPRPDFFYRCFPDGIMVSNDFECIGEPRVVNEGRKSFPSGHSSFAFAGFGFVFLYLAAKLHVFNERGRGQAWRLCLTISPLIAALLVAISRTCDYHHHWQDVTVGSALGMFVTLICYRQYFPSIFASNSHRSFSSRTVQAATCCITSVDEDGERKPLIDDDKETKWI